MLAGSYSTASLGEDGSWLQEPPLNETPPPFVSFSFGICKEEGQTFSSRQVPLIRGTGSQGCDCHGLTLAVIETAGNQNAALKWCLPTPTSYIELYILAIFRKKLFGFFPPAKVKKNHRDACISQKTHYLWILSSICFNIYIVMVSHKSFYYAKLDKEQIGMSFFDKT